MFHSFAGVSLARGLDLGKNDFGVLSSGNAKKALSTLDVAHSRDDSIARLGDIVVEKPSTDS